MYDIFHMISVRLLECLTPIIWKMDVMSVGERSLSKKGATFRKLFTAIGGAHFKSATEIVVNNSQFSNKYDSPKKTPCGHWMSIST